MKTPRARIKGMLRQIFLRSGERAAAMKKTGYCCEKCGIKQSKKKGQEVKLNVHHKQGISVWNEIIDLIYKHLLECELEVLCVECHHKEHHGY